MLKINPLYALLFSLRTTVYDEVPPGKKDLRRGAFCCLCELQEAPNPTPASRAHSITAAENARLHFFTKNVS
jgi:hypothetical protein